MSRNLRVGSVLVLTGTLLLYFVNCSGGSLPDNLNSKSNSSVQSVSALSLAFSPQQIAPSTGAAVAVINGGTPPYHFTVTSGTATVDSAGTVLQATAGTVTVEVTDANNNTAFGTINVANSVVTAAANCTTPWGVTIADGATIGGFAAQYVDCPTYPATCTAVTLTCTKGTLSGANLATVSPNCTYRACENKITSSNYGCITGMRETIVQGAPSPTCDQSQYHTFTCSGVPNAYGYATEYECVAPTEPAQ